MAYSQNKFGPRPPTLVYNIGGLGPPNFNGGHPPNFGPNFLNYTHARPSELERFPVGRAISEILWRKKKKKETSAVKYNTSGHYRGRRYKEITNYSTCNSQYTSNGFSQAVSIICDGRLIVISAYNSIGWYLGFHKQTDIVLTALLYCLQLGLARQTWSFLTLLVAMHMLTATCLTRLQGIASYTGQLIQMVILSTLV